MRGGSERHRAAAGGWRRSIADPLVKTRRMTDGEVTHLLVARADPAAAEALRDAAHDALLKVQEQLRKALASSTAAAAFALLVYEGALSSFSTSGLELDRLSFAHAALIAMSATGLWWATLFSRETYIATWFLAMFERSAPPERADMLLRYPSAFWPFQFLRTTRGYPPHVQARGSSLWGLFPLLLILAAIVIFAIGGIALWLAIAGRVWMSAYPSPIASKLTVIVSALLVILAGVMPRFDAFKRTYVHYGLIDLLTASDERRNTRAHERIARARWRMGLVDPAILPPPPPPPPPQPLPDPAPPGSSSPPPS